jgi:hypothetical protein
VEARLFVDFVVLLLKSPQVVKHLLMQCCPARSRASVVPEWCCAIFACGDSALSQRNNLSRKSRRLQAIAVGEVVWNMTTPI